MEDRINAAFDVCLSAIATGVPPEQCLQLYPELAADLRPLLVTVKAAQTLGSEHAVPGIVQNRSRARMLAQAAKLRQSKRRPRSAWLGVGAPRLLYTALALIFVFALSFSSLAGVSAKSLPGDALYPVKLAAENVRMQLAPNIEKRHEIEIETNHRRAEEVQALINLNRVELVSFDGRLEMITPEGWVVDGIRVVPDPNIHMIGNIQVGDLIEVEGHTQPDGKIVALEIHLRYFELVGEVEQINSRSWKIAGVEIKTIPGTQYSPSTRTGDPALALVYSADDGNLYAHAITQIPASITAGLDYKPFTIKFEGKVESLSSETLTVDGKTILLREDTRLTGDITNGTAVYVIVEVGLDSSLTALEVHRMDDTGDTFNVNKTFEDDDGKDDSQEDDLKTGEDLEDSDDGDEDPGNSDDDYTGLNDEADSEDEDNEEDNEEDGSSDEEDDGSGGDDEDPPGEDDDSSEDDEDPAGDEDDSSEDDEDPSDEEENQTLE